MRPILADGLPSCDGANYSVCHRPPHPFAAPCPDLKQSPCHPPQRPFREPPNTWQVIVIKGEILKYAEGGRIPPQASPGPRAVANCRPGGAGRPCMVSGLERLMCCRVVRAAGHAGRAGQARPWSFSLFLAARPYLVRGDRLINRPSTSPPNSLRVSSSSEKWNPT